jgi:hypothetical protein
MTISITLEEDAFFDLLLAARIGAINPPTDYGKDFAGRITVEIESAYRQLHRIKKIATWHLPPGLTVVNGG